MNSNARALVVSMLAFTALLAATVAGAAEPLNTRVTMVVGFPGSGDDPASVTVVPGTVIPVSKSDGLRVNVDEESDEQAKELQVLAKKLQQGVGLDSVEVAYSEVYGLEVDKPRAVTGPRASSAIQGELTLVDFNESLAVYRVVFRQGRETLADSKVAVERGGRAVVGGLDGEEAPYFFFVLEPAGRARFVKGASSDRPFAKASIRTRRGVPGNPVHRGVPPWGAAFRSSLAISARGSDQSHSRSRPDGA